jgi:hypothetical protein
MKLLRMLTNAVGQSVDLSEAISQSVCDLDALAAQLAQQLHVMVAGETVCLAERNHVADKPNGIEDAWSTIHKIPDENCLSSERMAMHEAMKECPRRYRDNFVAQLL